MIKYIHYKINWGDTLETISTKYNISIDDIKYINRLTDIYVGKILLIPVKTQNIIPNDEINITLDYCLKRHINKKNLFNFYNYKKITS